MGLFTNGKSKEDLVKISQECGQVVNEYRDATIFETEQQENTFVEAISTGVAAWMQIVESDQATPEQEAALKAFLEKYNL